MGKEGGEKAESPISASGKKDPKFYNQVSLQAWPHVPGASRDGKGTTSQAGEDHSILSQDDVFLCVTYQLTVTRPSCVQAWFCLSKKPGDIL